MVQLLLQKGANSTVRIEDLLRDTGKGSNDTARRHRGCYYGESVAHKLP